jgi:hypothetical protein
MLLSQQDDTRLLNVSKNDTNHREDPVFREYLKWCKLGVEPELDDRQILAEIYCSLSSNVSLVLGDHFPKNRS